jgi:hypothetical protein
MTTLTNEVIALIKVLFATIGSLRGARLVAEIVTYGIDADDALYAAEVSLGSYGWRLFRHEWSDEHGAYVPCEGLTSEAPRSYSLTEENKTLHLFYA